MAIAYLMNTITALILSKTIILALVPATYNVCGSRYNQV